MEPDILLSSLSSYIAMGGYGRYIWAAYGLVFGVMIALTVQSLLARRRVRSLLRQILSAGISSEGDDR